MRPGGVGGVCGVLLVWMVQKDSVLVLVCGVVLALQQL